MSKYFTLTIFIVFTTALFCTAHKRKFKLTRPMKRTEVCLHADSVSADSILHFAQSLIGTRYRSGSSSPLLGFDCSGFVSYVFKKFNFNVPRSSYDFANVGKRIRLEDAQPGDIILFTGTKRHARKIGHVGIVYCNSSDEFKFIHSTSGKEHGVTITAMDKNYKRRFVEVVRLLI
ncbi:C40 family peptidase [Mucilaginibacter sp. SP1R1]|uniref:C40 family peptidase n=1 Tax=Mucilaginibacter sp. SP1R1 TaxID=2723091 RepID=UPI00160FA0EB|nr:C40 family peptidase [Mucilaginibacter sp. SP1R1]MBB6149684.1 cell wall-associated NlpC family hydrolase [Mucilaginibacter sp. SP1R1]